MPVLLADVLRGYKPPTESALADPIKQHFANLPAQTIANLAKQRQNIDQSLALDQNGIQIANPQALNEFMAEVPNVAGTFIGPSSPLWNKKAVFEAAKMEKLGVPAEEIWKKTYTGRGLDNQWRQEISDADMKFHTPEIDSFRRKKPINEIENPSLAKDSMYLYDLVHHPKLREAYPESADIGVFRGAKDQGGHSSPVEWDVITLNAMPAKNKLEKQADIADMEGTLVHELQHQIQSHEGFAKGGDTRDFKDIIPPKDILDRLHKLQTEFEALKGGSPERIAKVREHSKIADKYTSYGQYERLAGETEARISTARQKLTDKQRQEAYPFKEGKNGLDVPLDELLIRQFGEPIITRKQLIEQQIKKIK